MKQFWGKLFGSRDAGAPLYAAVVARGRAPHWYLAGGVADTIDGRFEMIAAILSVVLIRLETDPAAAEAAVAVTERFIEDMDAQLRQEGVGDVGIGKQVGKLVSALGGRIGAYREGLVTGTLAAALTRNLYRGEAPAPAALEYVEKTLTSFSNALAERPVAPLLAGELP